MNNDPKSKNSDLAWGRAYVVAVNALTLLRVIFMPLYEVARGVIVGTIKESALFFCIWGVAIPYLLHAFGLDLVILKKIHFEIFYPKSSHGFHFYRIFILIVPFWSWGFLKWGENFFEVHPSSRG